MTVKDAKVIRAEVVTEANPSSIPDGQYPGFWGGYEVKVVINTLHWRLKTDIGIRTPNAACIVNVKNGNVTVYVPERK